MNAQASKWMILQMVNNTTDRLDELNPNPNVTDTILCMDENSLLCRREQSNKQPDNSEILGALLQIAAQAIRASRLVFDKVDQDDLFKLKAALEKAKAAPSSDLNEVVDVPMPPVFDFVESHNLLQRN